MHSGLTQRPEGIKIEFDTLADSCLNHGFYDPIQATHVEVYFDGRYPLSDDLLTREERCMITMPRLDQPMIARQAS